MKIKRILAWVMAFVFSLNLIQINVNAEVTPEETKIKEENVVVSKEETSKFGTAKEVVAKIVEKSATGISVVAKLAFTGIKSLLKLVGTGIKYAAIGACMTVGGVLVIYAPEYVPDIVKLVKKKIQPKSKSNTVQYY